MAQKEWQRVVLRVSQTVAATEPRVDRRQQIVAAATAVLGRQGYASSSLKQVAKEAGIAPGLLHYYFQSKEELLLEVVAACDAQLIEDWDADTSGLEDPMARINAGIQRAVDNVSSHPELIRLLLETYVLGLDNPAIRERVQDMLEGYCTRIQHEIELMAGVIPAAAAVSDEFDFPGAIAGAINGIAFLSLVRDKSPEAAYKAFKMYLLGLAAVAYTAAGVELPEQLAELLKSAGTTEAAS
jgi:AcrR family transcriptional regulator